MKRGLHRPNAPQALPSLAEMWRLRMVHTDPHYLSEFLRRHAAHDLLALDVFPRDIAKEITESAALRAAAIQYLGCDPKDPRVVAVCPGDGASPRTAALLAFTTAWRCVSIDPALTSWHARWPDGAHISGRPVVRLETIAAKVEDVPGRVVLAPGERAVVLACHSHAPLPAALATVATPAPDVGVAAMPCCITQELGPNRPCDHEYIDDGVWSPHRVVHIWRPVKS